MRVRVNKSADPTISLTIIAADGAEYAALDAAGDNIIEAALVIKSSCDSKPQCGDQNDTPAPEPPPASAA